MFHVSHDFVDENQARSISETAVCESVVRDTGHDRNRDDSFDHFPKIRRRSYSNGDLRPLRFAHSRSFVPTRYKISMEKRSQTFVAFVKFLRSFQALRSFQLVVQVA